MSSRSSSRESRFSCLSMNNFHIFLLVTVDRAVYSVAYWIRDWNAWSIVPSLLVVIKMMPLKYSSILRKAGVLLGFGQVDFDVKLARDHPISLNVFKRSGFQDHIC